MPQVTPGYTEGSRGTMAVDWEQRIDMSRLRRERTARANRRGSRCGL